MQCTVKFGSHGQPNGWLGTRQKPSCSEMTESSPFECIDWSIRGLVPLQYTKKGARVTKIRL